MTDCAFYDEDASQIKLPESTECSPNAGTPSNVKIIGNRDDLNDTDSPLIEERSPGPLDADYEYATSYINHLLEIADR